MASDVVSIVQELIYETDTSSFEAIDKAFGKQFSQIKDLQAQQAVLQKQIETTNAKDLAGKRALEVALTRNKAKIDELTISIGKEFAANEKLNKSFDNTGKQARNLGFAFSQILREGPAFAFSAQTGILAISNNIPILLDQLKEAKSRGASATDVFRALGASLFSMTGILTIAVSVLTIFGGELFGASKEAKKAEDDVIDLTKALDDYIRAIKDANRVSKLPGTFQVGVSSAQLQRDLELLKARGASAEEVAAKEQEISRSNQTQLELIRQQLQQAQARIRARAEGEDVSGLARLPQPIQALVDTKDSDAIKKRLEEVNNEIANEENKRTAIRLTRLREDAEERRKLQEKQLKDNEDYIKRLKDQLNDIEQALIGIANQGDFVARVSKLPDALPDFLQIDGKKANVGDLSAPTTGGKTKRQRDEERRQARQAAEEQVKLAVNALQQIYDAQLAYADKEIALHQTRIGIATTLAERGNTELLKSETERLEAAQRKRDEIGRKQIQLNNLITISEQAKNVAEAIGAVIGAAEGDPYTLALRVIAAAAAIGAATAAVSAAVRSQNAGFAEGGYTGQGGKFTPAGTVHKGEFVFNQEKTAKYRAAFEAIHAGANPVLAFKGYYGGGNSVSMNDTNTKLDALIDATNASKVNNKVFLNENGVYSITERQNKLNRRRFGRG